MSTLCEREISVLDWQHDALESVLMVHWLKRAANEVPVGDLEASVLDVLDYDSAASATADGGNDGTKGE